MLDETERKFTVETQKFYIHFRLSEMTMLKMIPENIIHD